MRWQAGAGVVLATGRRILSEAAAFSEAAAAARSKAAGAITGKAVAASPAAPAKASFSVVAAAYITVKDESWCESTVRFGVSQRKFSGTGIQELPFVTRKSRKRLPVLHTHTNNITSINALRSTKSVDGWIKYEIKESAMFLGARFCVWAQSVLVQNILWWLKPGAFCCDSVLTHGVNLKDVLSMGYSEWSRCHCGSFHALATAGTPGQLLRMEKMTAHG